MATTIRPMHTEHLALDDSAAHQSKVHSFPRFLFTIGCGCIATAVGVYALIIGVSGLAVVNGVPAKDVWSAGIPLEYSFCTTMASLYMLFWGCVMTAGFGIPTGRCVSERVGAHRRHS